MIETELVNVSAIRKELLSDQSVRGLLTLFEDVQNNTIDRVGLSMTDQIIEKVGLSVEALGMIRLLAAQ